MRLGINTFSADLGDIERLAKDLKLFASYAHPYAVRSSLTRMAFHTRGEWQRNISQDLQERNTYTRRSIRVDIARSLAIESMQSEVGSIAPYMDVTEEGGYETGTNGGNKAIPTGASAGQRGQRPRTKMPKPSNRMKNITIGRDPNRRKWHSKKQEIFVRVLMAAREGYRHIYLDTGKKPGGTSKSGGTRGIFRITGRGRLDKNGQMTGVRMEMVQNLTHTGVRVPPHPTLQPALVATERGAPTIFRLSLMEQLKRNRVFGYR